MSTTIAQAVVEVSVDKSKLDTDLNAVQSKVNAAVVKAQDKYRRATQQALGNISRTAGAAANNIRSILRGAFAAIALTATAFAKDTRANALQLQNQLASPLKELKYRLSDIFIKTLRAPVFGKTLIEWLQKLNDTLRKIDEGKVRVFIKAVESLSVLFLAAKAIEKFAKAAEMLSKLSVARQGFGTAAGAFAGSAAGTSINRLKSFLLDRLFSRLNIKSIDIPKEEIFQQIKDNPREDYKNPKLFKSSRNELLALQGLLLGSISKTIVPLLKIFSKIAGFGAAIGLVVTAIIRVISYIGGFKNITEALGWVAEKTGNIIKTTVDIIDSFIDAIAGSFIYAGTLIGAFANNVVTAFQNMSIAAENLLMFGSKNKRQEYLPYAPAMQQAQEAMDKFMRRNVTPIETGQKSPFDLGAYKKFIEDRDKLSKTIKDLGTELSDIIKSKLGFGGDIVGFTEGISKAQDIQYKWQEKQLEDNKKIIKLQEEIKENTNQQNELFKSFLRLVSIPAS